MAGTGRTQDGLFLVAGIVSLALHLLLGWGLMQAGHRTDTAYAGQAPTATGLFATLVRAPLGRASVALPQRPMPAPLPAPVERSAPPVPVLPMQESAGLDPDAPQVQHGPAGDEGEADAQAADPFGDYMPAGRLDMVPMPVTAPDTRYLEGMTLSVSPVGVKLYVDAAGSVRKVVVEVPENEQAAAGPLRDMFRHTRFVPGRYQRHAVASVLAIQVRLSELLSIRRMIQVQ